MGQCTTSLKIILIGSSAEERDQPESFAWEHPCMPENQVQPLEVFLWLSIPSHLAASPAQPSPQDPPDFSKEGRMILSGPSLLPTSSHFRNLCQEPASQAAGETRCPLIFICASAGCGSWNLLFPVPLSGRYSSHPRAEKSDRKMQPASTDWTDWLSQGRNWRGIAEGRTSWCFGE